MRPRVKQTAGGEAWELGWRAVMAQEGGVGGRGRREKEGIYL